MAKGWEFKDNSKKVKKQLANVSEKAMEAAVLLVESQAKSLAPVGDTGELRDRLDHNIKINGENIIGQVGSPSEHAVYNEFGTGEFAENGAGRKGGWSYQTPDGKWHHTTGMAPRPFLRPAFRLNKKNIEKIIGQKLNTSFKGE